MADVDEDRADGSRVAGSISRALLDAAAQHSPRLAELWGRPVDRPVTLDAGPWDD